MRRYHPLRKRIIAAAMAVSLAAASLGGYIAYGYKNSVPDWIVGSGKDSWGKGVEEYAVEKGLVPTGLGLTGPYWNNSGEGEFPYTFVTTIDAVESGDKGNAGFEEFKGLGIYCAAAHEPSADLRYGTQFFFEKEWNESDIPKFVVGTGDQQKFNFLMMVSAIAIAEKLTDHPRTGSGNYNGAAQYLCAFPIIFDVTEERPLRGCLQPGQRDFFKYSGEFVHSIS